MIDHLSLVVRDYDRSKLFYSKALAPTGHAKVVELGGASAFE
jgi:catechol 2,3-dioxygenase-like lactoylglutathione lyase family enzyme